MGRQRGGALPGRSGAVTALRRRCPSLRVQAAQRTLVTAVTVAGGDAALRVLLLSLGIPLYYIR